MVWITTLGVNAGTILIIYRAALVRPTSPHHHLHHRHHHHHHPGVPPVERAGAMSPCSLMVFRWRHLSVGGPRVVRRLPLNLPASAARGGVVWHPTPPPPRPQNPPILRRCFIELVWWLKSIISSSFWVRNQKCTTTFQGLQILHQFTIAFV